METAAVPEFSASSAGSLSAYPPEEGALKHVVAFEAAGLGHFPFEVVDVSDRCRSIGGRLREEYPPCYSVNTLTDGISV